jgi:transcriptional regulator with XRE-family HTH domain
MTLITLETLGETLRKQRGPRGVRQIAGEIGISTATLSRIENGHLPDLETFRRVCVWVGADPSSVLGFQNAGSPRQESISKVHFKKKKTQSKETLRTLGEMIAAAQQALDKEE